jgi:CMP-N-acetylneuraminic acid synthetase
MGSPTIAALVAVRKNSQRCPEKMLRPFAGTTLVDISLKRLAALQGFSKRYFAAHEDVFLEKARAYDVTSIRRSHRSANIDEPINQIHDYLQDVDEDHIMWINSCNVFLTPETIERARKCFLEKGSRSMTAVVLNRNWFYWPETGKPINNLDPTNVSTKSTPPLYEVVHAFHIFDRKYFLKNSAYWRNEAGDPALFVIPENENFDIDTEWEFELTEALYKRRCAV